uniref:OJ000315_02.16 protein n=1 Tax=Oryza sativa subsp. japonica TaxID=39947 RepID=Q7XL01_ORYSJ|nr:OJ000315_02.16 [Oryza sativa Japonica Group]
MAAGATWKKQGMSTMYHQQPVLVGIMPDTYGIADRYPVSCLVSGLIPVGIRLGTWVSWLGVRPGTRRYQTCYLISDLTFTERWIAIGSDRWMAAAMARRSPPEDEDYNGGGQATEFDD